MSGICGMCGGRAGSPEATLDLMLSRLSVHSREKAAESACGSARLGVSARWATQEIGELDGIYVAADTDLVNSSAIRKSLKDKNPSADFSSTPKCIAWLYRLHGLDFVRRLEGAFAIAI